MTTVLAVVRAAALCAVLSLLVLGGLRGEGPGDSSATESAGGTRPGLADRAADTRCAVHSTGAAGAGSAVIRTARGDLRTVPFERGWDVYTGRQPGTLVAVCLEDRAVTPQRALSAHPRQ